MNNMRIASLSIIALIAVACFMPMVFDESDAYSSERIATRYVYCAQFELEFPDYMSEYDDYEDWLNDWNMYFVDGSTNDQAMDRYLKDPLHNSLTGDDRSIMENYPEGTPINIYSFEYSYNPDYPQYINYFSQTEESTKVLDPYGALSFFVKAGDTFSLDIISLDDPLDHQDESVSISYDTFYTDLRSDLSYEHEFTKSVEIHVKLYSDSVYTDVVYDVSGASQPNGSATAYIAVCALVTVAVLLLLIYFGRKPGWSK